MKRLRLVSIDLPLMENFLAAPTKIEAQVGGKITKVKDILHSVIEQTHDNLTDSPRPAEWGAFLAVDDQKKQVVGTCAYKDVPTPDGEVEIAYFTFPPYEGNGYGTAMATELVARAKKAPQIHKIVAHTSPEKTASGRVLEKVGLKHVGDAEDPDDGPVWRWELAVKAK